LPRERKLLLRDVEAWLGFLGTVLKMAIVAPIPIANVATAANVNAGAATSFRAAYRKS